MARHANRGTLVAFAAIAIAWAGCAELFGVEPKELLVPTSSSSASGGGSGGSDGGSSTLSSTAGPGGSGGAGGQGGDGGGIPCFDDDEDGVTDCDGDCDDDDPDNYPGNDEICGDLEDNDCDMEADEEEFCQGLGTFVSSQFGDDSFEGTLGKPVKTISQGIANALIIGNDVDVYVAQGTYAEAVTMEQGVSVLGGHKCAAIGMCDFERDPEVYVSTIENTTATGVVAPSTVTRITTLDGFTIEGLDGANGDTSAVRLAGGSPVISNNNIFAGDVDTGCNCSTAGIRILTISTTKGPLIENNRIEGGSAPLESAGIKVGSDQLGSAEVIGNRILGGDALTSWGVTWYGSDAEVVILRNNVVDAGDCAAGGSAHGIGVGGGTFTIEKNLINTNAPPTCTGGNGWSSGLTVFGSTTTVQNNVIFGTPADMSAAILVQQVELAFGDVVINSNTMQAVAEGASATTGAAVVVGSTAIGDVDVGRLRNNILMGGNATTAHGILEDESANIGRLVVANNNSISDVDTVYRKWDGGSSTDVVTVMLFNAESIATLNIPDDCAVAGDYHIPIDSPCIDAGTLDDAPLDDFDGETRPQGAAVDIGADEAG